MTCSPNRHLRQWLCGIALALLLPATVVAQSTVRASVTPSPLAMGQQGVYVLSGNVQWQWQKPPQVDGLRFGEAAYDRRRRAVIYPVVPEREGSFVIPALDVVGPNNRRGKTTAVRLKVVPVAVSVEPTNVFTGQTVAYKLQSFLGDPQLQNLPDVPGIKWSADPPSRSTNMSMVNFSRRTQTTELVYRFTPTKPGRLTIPPIPVLVKGRSVKTAAVTVNVQKEDRFRLKVLVNDQETAPGPVYPGQDITVRIELYVKEGVDLHRHFYNAEGLFPKIEVENAVIRDFSNNNEFNDQFLLSATIRQEGGQNSILTERRFVDGVRYTMYSYETHISAIEAGTVKGTISHVVPYNVSDKRSRRRDPFDSFFQRQRARSASVSQELPPISVMAPPKDQPEDGAFLGLIGQWAVDVSLDKPSVSVGDDVTLTMSVKGKGNVEALTPPDLDLKGFVHHPPEVEKHPARSTATVRWVLIPRSQEATIPEMKVYTLDPVAKAYKPYTFQPELTVTPSAAPITSGPVITDYNKEEPTVQGQSQAARSATDILYIKHDLGATVRTPLMHNARLPVWILAVLGPLVYALLFGLSHRQQKLAGSESYRRQREASRLRGQVLGRLRSASAADLPTVIREELQPYLAAKLNLPPGATTAELLERIDDQELVEMLKQAEAGGFMPGTSTTIDANRLIQKVKALSVMLFGLFIAGAPDAQAEDVNVVTDKAAAAYDNAQLDEAERLYESLLNGQSAKAAVLFNLGNCAFRMGDYGRSIVYYERARRLAPRDSDIVENLNFVRSQLNLPALNQKESPAAVVRYFRDHLRPDEWCLLGAAMWCLVWLLLGVGRWRNVNTRAASMVAGVLVVVSAAAWFTQSRSTFRPGQALVVGRDAGVYALPQQDDRRGTPKLVLEAGRYVDIRETRTNWVRIRVDQDEGWVRRHTIAAIWTVPAGQWHVAKARELEKETQSISIEESGPVLNSP